MADNTPPRTPTASPPVGPGRGLVRLPQAPGGQQAYECIWVREVVDCPRIRDKVMHPLQCSRRQDRSGYTLFPPR